MPVCELKGMEVPSSVMKRGFMNALSPTAVSEVSLGKSICHFILSSPLRMINSLDLSLDMKALSPS